MLSQLLFVRLKAAENALRDGRLDEAYRLATAPDIREHRRGVSVLKALTKGFIERARLHYRADRFAEALCDLDRAGTGGVMEQEVAQLRDDVQTVAAEHRRQHKSRSDRLDAARRRIEGGSLVAGRDILDRASKHDQQAHQLRGEVDDRLADVGKMVEQAEKLMAKGQWSAAANRLREARSLDAHSDAVSLIETRLCDQVLEKTRAAIREGRLARAADELGCLGKLGSELPARRELDDLLSIARQATECVQAHAHTDARRHLMSLARLLPESAWVDAVIDQLRRIDDLHTTLMAGPLGDRAEVVTERQGGVAPDAPRRQVANPGAGSGEKRNLHDTMVLPGRTAGGTLPERLLLLIDGGGSYLLMRCAQTTIGRLASSHPADVPLLGDLAERHANIARVEDDYFLFSAKDVEVGGRKTRHHLLRDGDRVVLGRKAKFTFRLPSRKSPTGVLDLSDTTKMPNDVRKVVLFHRQASVGAGRNAHLHCQHAGTPLVLFERAGSLWLRRKNNGHVDTEPVKLSLGKPVEIAGVSLVLEPWVIRTPGGRVV